jgi:hypothetical protein
MSRLLDFYRGEAADAEGRFLDDILDWSDDKRLLSAEQPVESADATQDVSRVGALSAARLEPTAFAAAVQERVEPARRRARNSHRTGLSKQGSVGSRARAYFQSMRARTASAA